MPLRPRSHVLSCPQALCKQGKGHIRLNGSPLHLAEPAILRIKILEPILLLGRDKFAGVDMRVRCTGGGFSSQVYAIRQAIAKSMVAYTQKCQCCAPARVRLRGGAQRNGSARGRVSGGTAAQAARGVRGAERVRGCGGPVFAVLAMRVEPAERRRSRLPVHAHARLRGGVGGGRASRASL